MGFTLKPGRFHDDGIRDNHVKFPDGSGIELLAPPEHAVDEMTVNYLALLHQGDGPAYISFHARNTDQLTGALSGSGFPFKQEDVIFLDDPVLSFLFFDQDNRSPTDEPQHFVHANGAIAMTRVWLAVDAEARRHLTKLLLALGARSTVERVFAPDPIEATAFTVQNGHVVLLPKQHQWVEGRPVIGAVFLVRDVATTAHYLDASKVSFVWRKTSSGRRRLIVKPRDTCGLWLEFRED